MITLLIYAPPEDFTEHAPTGFIFTNELFAAQKLTDPISNAQQLTADLARTVTYLIKRYPGRLRVRWVNPWSLLGLWVSVRYRLRTTPAVLIGRNLVLTGEDIKDLSQHVANILAKPTNALNE
jgi:hypothetical protein